MQLLMQILAFAGYLVYNNIDINKGRYMYGHKGGRQAFNEKEAPLRD